MPETTTRIWGKHTFEFICEISPEADGVGMPRPFMPQMQYDNRQALSLSPYGKGPFCKFHIPNNTRCAGVYVLAVSGAATYVGECVNLSARYNMGYGIISPGNCYEGGQPTNCRINNLIYTAAAGRKQISLWFVRTADRKTIEQELIEILQPTWNRKRTAHVAVYRRRAASAAGLQRTGSPSHTPGVSAVFEPGTTTRRRKNMAGKYTPLQTFLEGVPSNESDITLSFERIENLIVGGLPASAYRHRPWWSNELEGSHVQAHAWMDAGWLVGTVDPSAGWVRFVRAR